MNALVENCPVCDSPVSDVFMEIPSIPVFCNVLCESQAAARSVPRRSLQLGLCRACSHIFNVAFEPALMTYTEEYENSLDFSPRYQRYILHLASGLVRRHHLKGKCILELGCGQGRFLGLLCRRAEAHGIGIDPGYRCVDGDLARAGVDIRFISDCYGDRYASLGADFVCCRHMLEHVPNPRVILSGVWAAIAQRPGAGVYFEVPNARATFSHLAVWDLIYEHFSYFTRHSLARLFLECGFRVLHLRENYGAQFLAIEAAPRSAVRQQAQVPQKVRCLIREFPNRYRQKTTFWRDFLVRGGRRGRRIVVWGAGSKGTTFLNILGFDSGIEYVVDSNPAKQNKFLAGAGQMIVHPEFLREYRPDLIIIMNKIYEAEIRHHVNGLNISPDFLCA